MAEKGHNVFSYLTTVEFVFFVFFNRQGKRVSLFLSWIKFRKYRTTIPWTLFEGKIREPGGKCLKYKLTVCYVIPHSCTVGSVVSEFNCRIPEALET